MKTDRLTAHEIAFKQGVSIISALQRATIEASLRTGRRYGVQVGAGKYDVVVTKFALNVKGDTRGTADVEILMPRCSEAQAIDFLDGLTA